MSNLKNKYNKRADKKPLKKGNQEIVKRLIDNEEKPRNKEKKTTFLLDSNIHMQLKLYSARHGLTMTEVVENAVLSYMQGGN